MFVLWTCSGKVRTLRETAVELLSNMSGKWSVWSGWTPQTVMTTRAPAVQKKMSLLTLDYQFSRYRIFCNLRHLRLTVRSCKKNWSGEGSQRANDSYNVYYKKENIVSIQNTNLKSSTEEKNTQDSLQIIHIWILFLNGCSQVLISQRILS